MRRTAMQKLKRAENLVLEPMSFTEFLLAQNETGLVDCLRNWDRLEPLPQLLFEPLSVKCRHYHTVGGLHVFADPRNLLSESKRHGPSTFFVAIPAFRS